MIFNSIAYAIFLPIVFALYYCAKKSLTLQNIILLAASYVFYSWWDYRFLFMLIFSTLLDYFSGIQIHRSKNKNVKKRWLILSVCINLGLLCFFKYFNFFAGSLAGLMNVSHPDQWLLDIVLPVGISFYTFHGLSYVFDIYNDKTVPNKNFVEYALFVSFFPLLVSGPIERATHLLPQISKRRIFKKEAATDGLRQILWGLFKKVVVADNCALTVNEIFSHASAHRGSTLLYGAILFAIQIYGDFSGYTDIALGSARLFGFELIQNFNFPYFSLNIAEFWRRWHISLSTWFRDYLYIPLGGSRDSNWLRLRNTLIIFTVSGFWHGANWTFIAWGFFNGLLFIFLLMRGKKSSQVGFVPANKYFPTFRQAFQMLCTFLLITAGWIMFRSTSIGDAFAYFNGIFSKSFFSQPELFDNLTFKFVLLLFITEWFQRDKQHALQITHIRIPAIRWGIYCVLIYFICYCAGAQQEFIYFQF